jgi:hypothetical protein
LFARLAVVVVTAATTSTAAAAATAAARFVLQRGKREAQRVGCRARRALVVQRLDAQQPDAQ